jgi:hypothetical protein
VNEAVSLCRLCMCRRRVLDKLVTVVSKCLLICQHNWLFSILFALATIRINDSSHIGAAASHIHMKSPPVILETSSSCMHADTTYTASASRPLMWVTAMRYRHTPHVRYYPTFTSRQPSNFEILEVPGTASFIHTPGLWSGN